MQEESGREQMTVLNSASNVMVLPVSPSDMLYFNVIALLRDVASYSTTGWCHVISFYYGMRSVVLFYNLHFHFKCISYVECKSKI